MSTKKIILENIDEVNTFSALIKPLQKLIANKYNTKITLRDRDVIFSIINDKDKSNLEITFDYINQLRSINYSHIDSKIVLKGFNEYIKGNHSFLERQNKSFISVMKPKSDIYSKTAGQQEYIDILTKYSLTICTGPAGTGKTYIAIAKAVNALINNEVNRIILTRPAIEAGESLGFLPGDLKQKIDPYIRPLFDALHDMIPSDTIDKYIEKGIIEVAPLAYMRGRTLNHSFIILDEAQNTTNQQMLMFLTRLGFESKCVITGDPSQVDLSDKNKSGLIRAHKLLKNIDQIGICELNKKDVIRHPIVQKIIEAYNKDN